MSMSWNAYAFVRLVVVLALGIVLGTFQPHFSDAFLLLFLLSGSLYLVCWVFQKRFTYRFISFSTGFLALMSCFAVGYINAYWQAERFSPSHIVQYNEPISAFKADIISPQKQTAKSYRYEAQINAVKTDSLWYTASGKVVLYFQKDSMRKMPVYGDELVVNSYLQSLEPPKNPYEFNYKRFLSFQQIYHQAYVPSTDWALSQADQGNWLVKMSIEVRAHLVATLEQYVQDSQSLAIIKALSIGVKEDLDDQITRAYAAAGAMHVLAVSGLHVGIVFLIVATIFKRWRYKKRGRYFFAAVSLLILWVYAFITGFSPSVLRAVTMFSFIIVAQALQRRTNIYNTLAVSAFVLLMVNPYLLFSVGFQLSYLAVIGIVYFQPKFYKLLYLKPKWLDNIWAITCVSIAAQIATAPLGLLYFHQFPSYFFLSNLVVIPAATVILNGSLLLLAVGNIAILGKWLGLALDYVVRFVNYLVFLFEKIPHSTIQDVFITVPEIWGIYAVIISFTLLFYYRKLVFFKVAIVLSALLMVSFSVRKWYRSREQVLIQYAVSGETVIGLRNGFNQQLLLSPEFQADENSVRFHIKPSLLAAGVKDTSAYVSWNQLPFIKSQNGLYFTVLKGKRLMWLTESYQDYEVDASQMKVEYLILTRNTGSHLKNLLSVVKPALVIIDSSVGYYERRNMEKQLERLNLPFHTITEKGAIEIKL